MHLQATELVGGKPMDDFTVENVTVMIIDVNDQPPVFNQAQYSIGIPENLGITVFRSHTFIGSSLSLRNINY